MYVKQYAAAPPVRGTLFFSLCLILTLFLPSSPGLFAANRTAAPLGGNITNLPSGDFEAPALSSSPGYAYAPTGAGWTFVGGSGLTRNNTAFTNGNANAPSGAQVAFLQGTGRISKSVNLVAGQYNFYFRSAQRGNHQLSYQTVQLRVDGNVVATITPSGTSYQSFSTSLVNLSSGNHTIEFRGLNPNGGDNTAFVDLVQYRRVANTLVGGFESPVITASSGFQYGASGGGWTLGNGAGISRNNSGFTNGNPNAPEGNQVLFLQGGALATRTVNIPQTGYYRFTCRAALRGNSLPEYKRIRISLNGTEIGEFDLESFDYIAFATLPIYTTAGNKTLEVRGVNPQPGDNTGFLDDLRLEPVHDWQDASVWGGTVPNANDNATIPAGVTVAMHGTISANMITINGHVATPVNRDLNLSAKKIMVMGSNARFDIGQEHNRYTGNATITLTGTANDPVNGSMGTKFLGAMNNASIQLHGANRKSWSQLGANVNAGSNQITMKETVDWKVGDEIVVVSSRKSWNEAEKRTITAVSNGGKTFTLNSNLSYPHTGVVKTYTEGGRTWTADLRAQVGLLTHNIKVQGDAQSAASGFGGHIMIMSNSIGSASGIELYNMGQKAILGRYPFHWHMLGNVGNGQFFQGSSVHQSYNRALTIHGTESTLVQDNFFYDHIGHGVFLEDGSERFNVIRRNVTLLSKRPAPGEELTPSDNERNEVQNRTPSSYWITNPQNTFEDNVAAGTQGTGYWFAFPTSPMGASASDPRFSSMQPHKLPLISFNRNSAHSCMSGFDIFDQLNPDHSLKTNWGWDNADMHYIDNCLWYANDLAIYSGIGAGGPVENLVWRNNVFVENKVGSMLASFSYVDNSVFVANSGENLIASNQTRSAYRVYDGAGRVTNSHFHDWNASNASFLLNTGAAQKHTNHLLSGNTVGHSGFVRCVLPNFDVPPAANVGANAPEHPRFWSIVLKDQDGGITGKANTSMVSNHPFLLTGGEFKASNWTNTYRTDRHYAFALLSYDLPFSQIPDVTVTRTKAGTPTESVYYIDGYNEHHQLPFIVNDGFLYTYAYEALPSSKRVRMYMKDASVGDDYLVRFKDFGKLGGLSLSSTQGSLTSHGSLASLQASGQSGYYRVSGGDLYVKAVATGREQRFDLSWSSNFTVAKLDTDGDEMADGAEVAAGRHPFHAGDLAAEFASTGNFESWTNSANVSGLAVSGNVLKGTAINNGDAHIWNTAYDFAANEVQQIQVRLKASANTGTEIFFGTNSQPGFSGSRRVSTGYSGNGNWQILTFNMSGHASWNGTITDLRIDPVSGLNVNFEIDWIRAVAPAKVRTNDLAENMNEGLIGDLKIYPNPASSRVTLNWRASSQPETILLFDLNGRELYRNVPASGSQQVEIDLDGMNLANGIYMLEVVGEGHVQRKKLIKE